MRRLRLQGLRTLGASAAKMHRFGAFNELYRGGYPRGEVLSVRVTQT